METLKEITEYFDLKEEDILHVNYYNEGRYVNSIEIKGTGGYNLVYVRLPKKIAIKVIDGEGKDIHKHLRLSYDACKRFIEIFNLWEDKEKINIKDYCEFVSILCELYYDEVEFEYKKWYSGKFRFLIYGFTLDVFFFYRGDILETNLSTGDEGDYYSFGKVDLYKYDIFVIESSGDMYHVLPSIVNYIV